MANKLHIVSFDVPYPPDYGGAIDVFYKVMALREAGYEVYLHCFEYGRGTAPELERICEKVWYYTRNTGFRGLSLSQPYIVSSRLNGDLLRNLCGIDAPILFEGVHTTAFLAHPSLKERFKAIRVHNVEHEYYNLLAQKAGSLFSGLYFRREARQLKKYEHALHSAQAFYALSCEDSAYFRQLYPSASHVFIPPFHQYNEVSAIPGNGEYCLYHGNLSHPENIEACLFLLEQVFPQVNMPVVIAGKKPVKDIVEACNQLQHCRLIADPTNAEMDNLVADAHIHALPTFQQSGMKLKLLAALYRGRHVIANSNMLFGTAMPAGICHTAENAGDFISAIKRLKDTPFSEDDVHNRRQLLRPYDNGTNAQKLVGEIFTASR